MDEQICIFLKRGLQLSPDFWKVLSPKVKNFFPRHSRGATLMTLVI